MRNAPPTFLVLPPAGDDTQVRFLNNLRTLALRTLLSRRELGSVGRALAELRAREPGAVLEAVGALDVLTPLLVIQRGGDPAVQLRAAVPSLLASLADRLDDEVLENGATEWAQSEVRPDLRPLNGVLLAVHAFVPVAAMHAALAETDHAASRDPQFEKRRREVVDSNGRGLATLERLGRPTEVGRRLLDGLRRLHELTAARH